jgi:hypothetical protein
LTKTISSLADIIEQITDPQDISLDCSAVARGIDNYHVDVEISASFTLKVRESIDQNLKRLLSGKSVVSGNSEVMHEVRDAYTDLMKVTMHRTKTDLNAEQILFLQFAIVKFVMQEVRDAIDRYGSQLEETLGQQQYSGSRSLLATQERVTWFRKHSNEFLFRLTRLYLRQLQREENNHLKTLREQILGRFPESVNVMFNPMLFGRTPRDPILLLDYYAVWPGNGEEFETLNAALESVFKKEFKNLSFQPLKSDIKLTSAQSEIYDELGGLFAAQSQLGPAEDQKEQVSESFSWLDHPGNLRLLFDEKMHARQLEREDLGFAASRKLKGEFKKLAKIGQELAKSVGNSKALRVVLASYALRERLTQQDLDIIEIEEALALVSGNDSRRPKNVVDTTKEGAAALQAKLEEAVAEFDRLNKEMPEDLLVKLLADYSRYRLHHKYYRFAHRIFNRLTVITDPQKIQLAKAGGHLYRLLSSAEVKEVSLDDEPEIVHHSILKADVRGSTTVTAELMKQGLNPASYFSLRFFNPINERLATYGAVKVFIEGDAVILGTYEYNNSPDEWFSVSRACGMAKEMLDIITSKNTNSKQTGLPSLEIGVGICYAEDKPLFLFDEDRPIMISSAIGDADRMSSCSWKLRDNYDAGNFRVGALLIADDQPDKGEKGQQLIRYNVNGIVIDDPAFEKLKKEVHFQRLKAKSGDHEENFYVGQYPDVFGKQRDLVVREGKVGTWQGDQVDFSVDTGRFYFEVLPNSKFASQIIELARNHAGTS